MIGEIKWLILCAALALGEALGFCCPAGAALRPAALVMAVFLTCFGYGWRLPKWNAGVLFLVGLSLAWGVASSRAELLDYSYNHGGAPLEVELTVGERVDVRRGADGVRWVSFFSEIGSLPVRAVFQVARGRPRPKPGERWRCAGWLARGGKVGTRGARTFWANGRGTYARRIAAASAWSASRTLAAARRDLSARLGVGLAHDRATADLNRAILLGERGRLPGETRDVFAAAGTLHVFAISGLHVMIVAGVLARLLLFTFLPVRWHALVLVPCLWAYVCMIGLPPSAVRAATMASLHFSAAMFWRRPNGIVSWALTFLAVHLLSPLCLLNVGSAFSFAVMLALVVWARALRPLAEGWGKALALSAVAWAAGVPIAASVFARVTPGAILANLVLVPTADLSVRCATAGVLASYVWRPLAAHVNNLSALLTRAMVGVSRAVASVPGANLEVEAWGVGQCAAWYAALALALFLVWRVGRRHRTMI